MSKESTKQWRIVTDEQGVRRVECPHCKKLNTIVEVDSAIRFNTLEFADDDTNAVARMGETGDWEFDHWFCKGCGSVMLAAPDNFVIDDWI